ncbi:cytidylyltransferase domain-containing protein [Zhaonella formicivorans]|uniref:acylneuraminate cytidylyltransferase family protein n=1 Tax=Zhaonella formicivorans TaxID=2528593 RepID=UPI0010E24438|nr:acylneuraminate cytidylyltransferase family protein [Zhaonella formicivorans]
MFNKYSILGIIPARAGSKGLPGKNIKPLLGKPLINYTIEEAKKSVVLDRLIVSTDSTEIALVAKNADAEVPFIRPSELATDGAKSMDVVQHAMRWIERYDQKYDLVMVLQPTSPLRKAIDILNALNVLIKKNANAVVSVCETEHHPWWCNTLPENGSMEHFIRHDIINTNRQELPIFFRLNGAIYLAKWDFLKTQGSWFGQSTFAYKMPRERSIDIDTELDFHICEIIMRKEFQ